MLQRGQCPRRQLGMVGEETQCCIWRDGAFHGSARAAPVCRSILNTTKAALGLGRPWVEGAWLSVRGGLKAGGTDSGCEGMEHARQGWCDEMREAPPRTREGASEVACEAEAKAYALRSSADRTLLYLVGGLLLTVTGLSFLTPMKYWLLRKSRYWAGSSVETVKVWSSPRKVT